jgi:protocatechuate 3,4-dioxygenase beta subunit
VLDEDGRPVRAALIELWQANASGRYPHPVDQHDAPLDPNFVGTGQVITDDEGRYRFVTIKPGAYPWGNHSFGWRPAHIHFSLFGRSATQRLITQMFFPGDPLLDIDPIFNSVPELARRRLIADLALQQGLEGVALGYRFDIVLGGSRATPMGV